MQTEFSFPTGTCRAGVAQVDITPPTGIYNRCWGAALHEVAAGVHRPFYATALVTRPLEGDGEWVLLTIDLGWIEDEQNDKWLETLRQRLALGRDQLVVALSHSHATANLTLSLHDKPGGHLIGPYWERLTEACCEVVEAARADLADAELVAAAGTCDLAHERNFVDEEFGEIVCGFNPEGAIDQTVMVGRLTGADGAVRAVLMNYGCHPTSLGPTNDLLSPDYVGAAREIVQEHVGAPCLFLYGAGGDVAPREGYAGNPAVADRNGRQLGYAALSVLESFFAHGETLAYKGPIVSGATLADWVSGPGTPRPEHALMGVRSGSVELPLKKRPPLHEVEAAYERASQALEEAKASGDAIAIRDATAMHERARRTLLRAPGIPDEETMPLACWCWRVGQIVFVGIQAEACNSLQVELRKRFPGLQLFVVTIVNGVKTYLMERHHYGRGLYQEWISPWGPGCQEQLQEFLTEEISSLCDVAPAGA